MNNFKDNLVAKSKNNLIATLLSYYEYYHPKIIIIENVENLVQNESGMVLKLILASLVTGQDRI